MQEHELKTWPTPFGAMWRGEKLYELRRDDREYKVGDGLRLQEWTPIHESPCSWFSPYDEQQTEDSDFRCKECGRGKKDPLVGYYTGRWILGAITCITKPGVFPGLEKGYVILGVRIHFTSEAGEPAW